MPYSNKKFNQQINFLFQFFVISYLCLFVLSDCGHIEKASGKIGDGLHEKTDWKIMPSFKFDVLCFLNALTGDPYYLRYYQEEYDRIRPKLTERTEEALANLKRVIKDENRGIISAFLCLVFSATDDETLDDLLRTLKSSSPMKEDLKKTPYYSDSSWNVYVSVKEDLETVFRWLKQIRFESYWKDTILPKVEQKIALIEENLPKYNVIREDEALLGFALPSSRIFVYMLFYSQPHGIKITGTRFLTDVAWPFEIVLRNAVHEMMHPPYDLQNDKELRNVLNLLKEDRFLMDKVLNHNPAFRYNSFEGFVEEDCVQALEQVVNERLGIAVEARKRWKESDDGMHVFAVALYSMMKEENYNQKGETFRDFLIRMIGTGKIKPSQIEPVYNDFYHTESRR